MGEPQQPIVHTPGPWEAILHDGGAFDVVNHDSPNHSCILAARNSYEARAGEMHANARLIAETPEMFTVIEIIANATGDTDLEYAQELSQEILMRLKVV